MGCRLLVFELPFLTLQSFPQQLLPPPAWEAGAMGWLSRLLSNTGFVPWSGLTKSGACARATGEVSGRGSERWFNAVFY